MAINSFLPMREKVPGSQYHSATYTGPGNKIRLLQCVSSSVKPNDTSEEVGGAYDYHPGQWSLGMRLHANWKSW